MLDELKRYATLGLASTVGIAGALSYAFLTWRKAASPGEDAEWVRMSVAFETCVVFFAGTYFSGWGFARLFKARALAGEIFHHGSWHLKLLGVVTALLAAERGYLARGRGFGRFDDWVALGFTGICLLLVIVFYLGPRPPART